MVSGDMAAFIAMELVCAALAWIVALRMRKEVNERLAADERIRWWMVHGHYWRMARLHREFYPASRLRLDFWLCLTGVILSIIGVIARVEFLR